MTILRRALSALCATALATAGTVALAPSASAADFYTPPGTIADRPGEVLRHESMPLLLQLPGLPDSWPGAGTRVMYTSHTEDDRPVAVSGTLIEPSAAWSGPGERPTVVIGPGTQGQGDQCAPSKMFTQGGQLDISKPSVMANYEAFPSYVLASLGMRVFVTDYVGLGTPGVHTYVNRLEEGHAMLDGARAALRLAGAPADAPVGFFGYSQGGGAAASAAELASTYAPELKVAGSYAGAPPADLREVLDQIDGTFIVAAVAYALNGFIERNPELRPILDSRIAPNGNAALRVVAEQCIIDSALQYGFQRTQAWTADGRTLSAHLAEIPEAMAIIDAQRIGNLRPNAPVLISTGVSDDVIPTGQAQQLGRDWCAQGATVATDLDLIPPIIPGLAANHMLPMLAKLGGAITFMMDRFHGRPAPSTC